MIAAYLVSIALLLLAVLVIGNPLLLWAVGLWLSPALLYAVLPPPGRQGRGRR